MNDQSTVAHDRPIASGGPPTLPPKMGHMPGLDGLRGVLILAIMTYHLGYADHMFVTVDTFFALSGFLITRLLLERTPSNAIEMGGWWTRRARRLVPAVAVTVAVVVIVFAERSGISWDGLATMTWWENWRQAFGATSYWSPKPSPLRHAWTLSIEEQFYLFWPITVVGLTVLAKRRKVAVDRTVGAVALLLGTASFVWAAWLAQTGTSLNRIYLGTDTRAGSLFFGCAIATLVWNKPTVRASTRMTVAGFAGAGLVLGLGLILNITDPISYSGGLFAGTVGSVILILAASRPGIVESVLAIRVLQWLGVRSYGIYLWAWPLQVFIEEVWPTLSKPIVAVLTFAISFVLGDLSLRLVERPLRNGTKWAVRATPRRLAWTGGLAALTIAIIGVDLTQDATPYYQEVSAEDSGLAALEAARESQLGMEEEDLVDTSTTSTVDTTTTPPPPEPMRIMTAGDSQAFNAAHPKIPGKNLPSYIQSVTVAGVLGCGILVRAPEWTMWDPERGGDVDGDYCLKTAEVAEVEALKARPDWMVVFSGGFERPFGYKDPTGRLVPARDPELRAAIVEHLTFRVERARAAGVRTALIEWACMGEEIGDTTKARWTSWHNKILAQVAASIPGTLLLKPNDNVCINSDPLGAPTAAKEKAWGYEVHPVDLKWLWNVQLGPELFAASVK